MLSLHMRWSYPYTDTKLGRLQWYWSASILSITGYLYWSQPLVAPIELGLWTGPIPHWGGPIVTCPPPAPASQSTARCFFCTTTIGINIIISFIKLTTPSCLRTFISPQKYKALSFFSAKAPPTSSLSPWKSPTTQQQPRHKHFTFNRQHLRQAMAYI